MDPLEYATVSSTDDALIRLLNKTIEHVPVSDVGLVLDDLDDQSQQAHQSKLGSMAFMQKAEAARKAKNDSDLKMIRKMVNGSKEVDHLQSDDGGSDSGRQKYGKSLNKPQNTTKTPASRQ